MELKRKKKLLEKIFKEMKSVLVALSAGVDSSLALAAAHRVLKEKAVGAIAISPSLHPDAIALARRIAKKLGAQLLEIHTREVDDENYQKNTPLRCYFCKHIVYRELKKIAISRGAVLVDGFNSDDVSETRPGMRAAKEQAVRHPLFEAGFTKNDVRLVAKEYKLPNWNRAADACLSSRFLTGIPVNSLLVTRIGAIESATRHILKLGPEHVLRVRHLGNGKARVEIEKTLFPLSAYTERSVRNVIKTNGYQDVSFAPYQRGSVSATHIYK